MKHLKYLLFALLTLGLQSCTTNVSNSPLSSNSLPLEAPYGGLKGEIDSVVSKSYRIKDGEKSGFAQSKTIAVYDKNGYVISNTTQWVEPDGQLLHSTENLTQRDDNSSIIGLGQYMAENRVTLGLDKREGDVSYYKITDFGEMSAQDKDSIKDFRIVQTIDREKRTMTLLGNHRKESVNYTARFDDMGKVVFSSSGNSQKMFLESTSEYDDKGLLIHSSTKTQFSADSTKNISSDSYYQNYTFETDAPYNWINREKVDAEGNVTSIDEQKIYYRN